MKKTITTLILFTSFLSMSQQVVQRTNTASNTNKSIQVYRQNSPGNTYGNSFVIYEVNYDSTLNHAGYIKIDILDNRLGYSPSKKFISADNNGYLSQGSFDNLTFPISQIVNLNSMLMDRITFTQAASVYQPIGGYLIGNDTLSIDSRINLKLNKSDTTGKWYPASSNPLGFINSGYTGFDIRYKPISYMPSNSEVISALGATPLFAEVDGSNINELELPAQSGQSGKVLGTNGTNVSWTTPNTGTVTSVGVSSTTLTLGGTNPVTSSGTISINIPNTGTAGTYGIVTTDAQGRITSGKRQETYSGTTSGSGTYTVTFAVAYSVAPIITPTCTNCTDTQRAKVSSITNTGFTIQGRNEALGLIFTNANGLNVDVLITEK